MLTVAAVGLVANAGSLLLLRSGQHASLNVRGAYLEVLGDLLGSVAVIVAAIVIRLTGFTQADAIASAAIGLMILPRTWALLREAVGVLLEATPKGVDLAQVRQHINDTPGVLDVHDLHAWTITSGLPVLPRTSSSPRTPSLMVAEAESSTSLVSASQVTSTSSTARSSSRHPVTASTNSPITPDLGWGSCELSQVQSFPYATGTFAHPHPVPGNDLLNRSGVWLRKPVRRRGTARCVRTRWVRTFFR